VKLPHLSAREFLGARNGAIIDLIEPSDLGTLDVDEDFPSNA
jgi:hypothetical protein